MAENLDIRENEMQQGTAAYLRGVASNGNSIVEPVSNFERKNVTKPQLSAKTLMQIASVSLWGRFAALCVIGSSDAINNCILRITGTIIDNSTPRIKAVYNGIPPATLGVSLLYKIVSGVLSVYLYSNVDEGSTNPLAIISSHPTSSVYTTDISGYTKITPSSE